ncbi:MAG: hypothetical protein DMD68_02475 [Gemmatimonadetes bacterium]|nr:MAG: hypothetical protein DMD68_02475 [Gemmatimonadota bacterium]
MVLLVALWTAAAAPPAQLPDTARTARVERVINAASDSISRLGGAASVFPLDLQAVSQALVLERAARVQVGCTGAAAGLESLLRVLGAETVTPRAAAEQARLRAAARDLRRTLVQCGREWNPRPPTAARADSLRDWGPYRIQQLDVALRRYDAARRAFQEKAGLQKPPPQ